MVVVHCSQHNHQHHTLNVALYDWARFVLISVSSIVHYFLDIEAHWEAVTKVGTSDDFGWSSIQTRECRFEWIFLTASCLKAWWSTIKSWRWEKSDWLIELSTYIVAHLKRLWQSFLYTCNLFACFLIFMDVFSFICISFFLTSSTIKSSYFLWLSFFISIVS